MLRYALLFLATLWLVACGGSSSDCALDNPCPAGEFCDGGTCLSECEPGSDSCADGVCTRNGRCAREQPDPEAGVCAAMVLEATFGIPTVLLLVDQSGSMDEAYSGGTRWAVLRDALIDPNDGVVTRLQSSMRFGLTLYTNTGGPTCPELTVVDPALDNRDAIATAYEAAQPQADTPTGEAIEAVTDSLVALDVPGDKYIIVASDGEPDTCAEPNPQNGQPEAVAAAQAAFDAGITLYFLSVGAGTISQDHLQDMANAGVGYEVGGAQNAPYYEAADAEQLAAAFEAITGGMLTCELDVNGNIDPEVIETGIIYLDGNRLTLGDSDGWELIDEGSFRLLGGACSSAQRAGAHTVTAEFGCETPSESALTAEGGGLVDGGCAGVWPGLFAAIAVALLLVGSRRRWL